MTPRPKSMKGFGVVFLAFGVLLFIGGQRSQDEGDRQNAGRIQAWGAFFGLSGAVMLAIGISRDRGGAASEVTAYRAPLPSDASDLAIRIAKEQPDLYKCFSNDAVFQGVVAHVASGQFIKAIQLIQDKSELDIKEAKALVDKVKGAMRTS